MADISDNTKWSQTDASNNQASPNGWPEGMSPSGVNDSARNDKGALKRFWDRINPTLTTGGTSTAYTLTYAVAPASYATGELFGFVLHTATGAAPTLNINGLGARNLRRRTSTGWQNVAANDYPADAVLLARIGATTIDIAISVAGDALPLTGGTLSGDLAIASTDAGAGAAPTLKGFRDSASPATSDLLWQILWAMRSSTGVERTAAQIVAEIVDATNGSEDADLIFKTIVAGALTERLRLRVDGVLLPSGNLELTSTSGGSEANPNLWLFRESASPAVNDVLGHIQFDGRTSTGARRTYAGIVPVIADTTNASEDAIIHFQAIAAGTLQTFAQVRSDIGVYAKNTPVAAVHFYYPTSTPAIIRSVNVSSLTDNGTGDTTVNLTTPIATNEPIEVSSNSWAISSAAHFIYRNLDRTPTTTALHVYASNNVFALVDGFRNPLAWIDGV